MEFNCNEGRVCVRKNTTTFACECPMGFQYEEGYYEDIDLASIYVGSIYTPGYCNGIFH